MSPDSTVLLNGYPDVNMDRIVLDRNVNCSNGRIPFYRGELFLDGDELVQLNACLADTASNFGKPLMVEVKTPPLVSIAPVSVFPSATHSPLPIRSTRNSVPGYVAPVNGGKSRGKTSSVSSTPVAAPVAASVTPVVATPVPQTSAEIGRASCRERV